MEPQPRLSWGKKARPAHLPLLAVVVYHPVLAGGLVIPGNHALVPVAGGGRAEHGQAGATLWAL